MGMRQIGRRGLVAGLAALGAGLWGRAARPALASHEGPMFIGFENVAEHQTTLRKTAGSGDALRVENSTGFPAIEGIGTSGDGILGFSSGNLKYALAGTGSYEVDYRVVAKVRGREGTRMEQVEPPTMPTPPGPKRDKP